MIEAKRNMVDKFTEAEISLWDKIQGVNPEQDSRYYTDEDFESIRRAMRERTTL